MSPPVRGMNELIADTSLSYAWLVDDKKSTDIWTKHRIVVYKAEWQDMGCGFPDCIDNLQYIKGQKGF